LFSTVNKGKNGNEGGRIFVKKSKVNKKKRAMGRALV
jgi:hypothetical protein